MVGTTFRGLGGPKNDQFWPVIAILAKIASNGFNIGQTGFNIVFHVRDGHLGIFCPHENVPGGALEMVILPQNHHIGYK